MWFTISVRGHWMQRLARLLTMTAGLVMLGTTPAAGQLWGFPDYALPSSGGSAMTFFGAGYSRGLNDASGKTDAYAAAVGSASGQISFIGAVGLLTGGGDDELTFGGALGVDLIKDQDSPYQVTLQGGIGWISLDFLGESETFWRFPIGVALKGSGGDGATKVVPWVMPRLNIARGLGETETDIGASAGLGITTEGGFGVHTALDFLSASEEVWLLGVGIHYVIPR